MTPIPLELITLFGSATLGGLMKIIGISQQARQLQHQLYLQTLNVKANIHDRARRYDNAAFQWTRRIIALTAVFSIILLPKVVAIFYPELPIFVGYPELSKGFLFFTSDTTKIEWVHMQGLVITPLDTHLLAAIIGMYFGGSLVGHKA